MTKKLQTYIRNIISDAPDSLKAAVATEALESNDIEIFFSDLLNCGCQSGMISSLIYYADTRKFYDKHYHEIEDLRYQYEADFGIPLPIKGDLKNWLAWFAFEETARTLADELHIKY